MRVAIECAGLTPGEADPLRNSMATFKHTGGVSSFKAKLVDGILDGAFQFIRVGITAYDKRLAGQRKAPERDLKDYGHVLV